MSTELITHNEDLKRLSDDGYALQIVNNVFLLIHHVPYVNSESKIKLGVFITNLNSSGGKTLKPDTHVAYFIGDQPCHKDGTIISAIANNGGPVNITNAIRADRTFSGRADDIDYYEKVTRYINIISSPAMALDDTVTPRTRQLIPPIDEGSPFHYADTNSAKAIIYPISNKVVGQKIGIIGVGGTGSYVLDFLAKTPVAEIRLFDGDVFLQNNAFRSPGATPMMQFSNSVMKVDYYSTLYGNMHKNILAFPFKLTPSNLSALENLDFVFICIDSSEVKENIFHFLESRGIAFIDCGLGVQEIDGYLKGQIRVTASTEVKRDHLRQRVSTAKSPQNLYDRNIQIADLNALNAVFAIIKWKKINGIYRDLDNEHFTCYSTFTNEIVNEDLPV